MPPREACASMRSDIQTIIVEAAPKPRFSIFRLDHYQTTQRSALGRTILELALHWKAEAKGSKFDRGPIIRNFATGCGSLCTISFWVSGRISSPRNWPQAMKNC